MSYKKNQGMEFFENFIKSSSNQNSKSQFLMELEQWAVEVAEMEGFDESVWTKFAVRVLTFGSYTEVNLIKERAYWALEWFIEQKGVSVESVEEDPDSLLYGEHLLMIASRIESVQAVVFLLKKGANPNRKTLIGDECDTPLLICTQLGSCLGDGSSEEPNYKSLGPVFEIAKHLIVYGANPYEKSRRYQQSFLDRIKTYDNSSADEIAFEGAIYAAMEGMALEQGVEDSIQSGHNTVKKKVRQVL